ncbi:MAG: hypothetical protein V7751_08980 [Pseudoalteromonas distincta]|jgi:hypothetical protein|tara:strand:- start:13302 stop:13670 length:369 start_codon:yes stop_codon:yes gene_type:complete
MDIYLILQRVKPRDGSSKVTHQKVLGRLQRLCRAINERFPEVRRPDQIKLKHLQYLRNEWLAEFSPATAADYQRTMCVLVESLGKKKDWLPPLKLVKDPSKGGRPFSTCVTKTKARKRRGIL